MQYMLLEDPLDMQELLIRVSGAAHTFMKFLTPNDLGLTGSNQAGLYIGKEGWPLFIETPGKAGENLEKEVILHWNDKRVTRSSFKWYGKSKSEYRLTRVASYFQDRAELHLGSLLILSGDPAYLRAWVLDREDDIQMILDFFGITPEQTGGLLRFDLEERLLKDEIFNSYVSTPLDGFPDTESLARKAQEIHRNLYGKEIFDPDRTILRLIQIEYALFRTLERDRYQHLIDRSFRDVDELLSVSLEINNRRKSRAGKSLELHLKYIFQVMNVPFSHGETSAEGKRPDFLFPGVGEYNDPTFPADRLFFLGAKTTCKDRWRQVLNEADRIPRKHLFTLQQGFSSAQLAEMRQAGVIPVIPAEYHDRCREQDRVNLMTLGSFIDFVLDANGREQSLFPS